jgi:hypothetical protein
MKTKTQTTYICSKCGLVFNNEKNCQEHEEVCGTVCEVCLSILVNGDKIKPSWSLDDSSHPSKHILGHLYKISKTGPYCYRCYSKSDITSINKAKETIMDFVIKEAESIKAFFIALKNGKED